MPHGDIIRDQPELLTKLETAYAMGCTDTEACLFAGVSTRTLYAYIEQEPSFTERKENLKQIPILKSRQSVVSKIADDVKVAQWYLERKTKEFRPPDRQLGNTSNTLILLTESQLKDRVAHKLSKLLSTGLGDNTQGNDSPDDVTDANYTDDMSNTEDVS